ncbi:MAG TPA: hypothetical protein VK674_02665 [Candidatus Limnocylindria bacterium]|nr:hypothetical protein [Candidatus Limnocylindria bacterium]
MIKNLLKGLLVLAVTVSLGTSIFAGQASAASTPIDTCSTKVLSVKTRKDEVSCTKMAQDMMNIAHVRYIGWQQHPGWPFVAVDGDFYTQTKQAVVAYQFNQVLKGNVIATDGMVGSNTWKAIKKDCREWNVWYCQEL